MATKIYQFKITLSHISPTIWRRIQVPENYSFWDLHVAIQDAMGWEDCHLHRFTMPNCQELHIGIPDDEYDAIDGITTLPGWETKIKDYFSDLSKEAKYLYDFGDNWEHIIKFEKILPRELSEKYPRCIGGARACPPEDCGSICGYTRLVEAMKSKDGEQYEDLFEWLGEDYNSEKFSTDIKFSSPKPRLKMLLEGYL